MSVKSNINDASSRASSLKTVTNNLKKDMIVSIDTNTTVLGNNLAKEVIGINKQVISGIADSINLASDNIKSVAEDFVALDNAINRIVGVGK